MEMKQEYKNTKYKHAHKYVHTRSQTLTLEEFATDRELGGVVEILAGGAALALAKASEEQAVRGRVALLQMLLLHAAKSKTANILRTCV